MKKGDLVAYIPKDIDGNVYKCEIGKVKKVENDSVFVQFHSGDTASKTDIKDLIKIENSVYIQPTMLGTGNIGEIMYAGYHEDNGDYTVEVKKQYVDKLLKQMFNADDIKII